MAEILEVDRLMLTRGENTLLEQLSFSLSAGETLSFMGRSGSGKSTLLLAILGMFPIAAGDIVIDGVSIAAAKPADVVQLRRRKIGTLFQSGELLSGMTVRENLQITGLLRGMPRSAILADSKRLLDRMEIDYFDESVDQLSGGEYQRVAIARALIGSPRLILADEPTGSLDIDNRDKVVQLLIEQAQDVGSGLILVTHDPEVAAACNRQYTFHQGWQQR